jgi:hypothetical protein
MGSETLHKEGNPILQGAEKLRSIVKTSVQENLEDIFPKNYHYMVGNYNLIYVIAEGYGDQCNGFYNIAQMVVLTPEGDIKSGDVYQQVESDHSIWQFRKATLNKASDLEVVRHTPQLVKNLFGQLEDELSEEENPQKINKGINFLFKNKELSMQTLAISYKALKEMGEEDPELSNNDTGQPGIEGLAEIIKAIEKQTGLEVVKKSSYGVSLDQKKAAIDLFMNKQKLRDELKDLSSNMRVSLVAKRFEEIVKEMVSKDIFPVTWEDEKGMKWSGEKEINFHNLSRPIYSKGRHRERALCISDNGQVREFEKKSGEDVYEPYFCAEHLLKQAPEIMEELANHSAKNFFGKIKV